MELRKGDVRTALLRASTQEPGSAASTLEHQGEGEVSVVAEQILTILPTSHTINHSSCGKAEVDPGQLQHRPVDSIP